MNSGPLLALLWRRFSWRHARLAPLQSGVLVLILALGIGVFFAMRLANRAVLSGFQSFTDLVGQESDAVLSSPAGSLPETTLAEVRALLGARPVTIVPVLEITGTEPARAGEESAYGTRPVYTILGVDLAALPNLVLPVEVSPRDRTWLGRGLGEFWGVLRRPRAAYLSPVLARRAGLAVGGRLPLVINDRVETLEVAGLLPPTKAGEAPAEMILMDLPEVQALGRVPGRVERLELLVEPGAEAARWRTEALTLLREHAEGRWSLSSPGERRESAAQMTEALRLNLTLLSTLALLVGFYFIYQALDGAVVRRREEIATLRSLGVTEWEIRSAWLLEALGLGLAGSSLGSVLGWLGAQGAVRLVSRSVNALYHASHVERAPFAAGEFLLALGVGVFFSVVAGWFPAREAARTPPAQALRRQSEGRPARRRWWPALSLLALAGAAAASPPWPLPGGSQVPVGGYVATLATVLAASAGAGPLLGALAGLAAPWRERSVVWRLALSQVRRPALRQVIATACLLAAVAMAGGMAVLVGSYDYTMRGWLMRTFVADLYLSSEGAQSASSTNRLPPETWRAIAQDPAVADFYAVAMTPITLARKSTLLAGGDLRFLSGQMEMSWLRRPGEEMFEASRNAGLALVSEAFMRRFQRSVGDEFDLPTPAGPRRVRVAGVFADYGNERGTVLIDRQHFAEWWGHDLVATLTLKLKPGLDPQRVRAGLRERFPGLNVFTNRALREQALRIFQETFSVTYALEIIGVAVAVIGLGLTLTSIFLQRRGELGTLRALAWTQGEIARAASLEGLLLAAVGLAEGLLVSLVLGALLVYVINRQAFGWTLSYHVPWLSFTVLAVLVLASGAVTSFFVGRWAAQLPADREE